MNADLGKKESSFNNIAKLSFILAGLLTVYQISKASRITRVNYDKLKKSLFLIAKKINNLLVFGPVGTYWIFIF